MSTEIEAKIIVGCSLRELQEKLDLSDNESWLEWAKEHDMIECVTNPALYEGVFIGFEVPPLNVANCDDLFGWTRNIDDLIDKFITITEIHPKVIAVPYCY